MNMNPEQIERFKSLLTLTMRRGCEIQIPSHGFGGKIISIGFKPFWTHPMDTKISGLNLDCLDKRGAIKTYVLHDIVGYEIVSHDGADIMSSKTFSMDVYVFVASKAYSQDPYDKIRMDFYLN